MSLFTSVDAGGGSSAVARMALSGYGLGAAGDRLASVLGPSLAARAERIYGASLARVLDENPYRLLRDLPGLGWRRADAVAAAWGVAEPTDSRRLRASLRAAVAEEAYAGGHAWTAFGEAAARAAQIASLPPSEFERLSPAVLELDRQLVAEHAADGTVRLYLPEIFQAEADAARGLSRLLRTGGKSLPASSVEAAVGATTSGLPEGVRRAVRVALTSPVSVVTGAAGTGKGAAVAAIRAAAEAAGLHPVLLCAPSGRAATRLGAGALPVQVFARRARGDNSRGLLDTLEAGLVVVDQAMMLDTPSAADLLSSLRPGTHLVFVGDPAQPAPSGPGQTLLDLLAAGDLSLPVTRLTEPYNRTLLTRCAADAAEGLVPRLARRFAPGANAYFYPGGADIVGRAVEVAVKRIPARFSIPPEAVRVLTARDGGEAGADRVGVRLKAALLGRAGPPPAESYTPEVGDRVVWAEDSHDTGLMWGDEAVILDLDAEQVVLRREGGGEIVVLEPGRVRCRYAQALSITRAQGAEYRAVVLLCAPEDRHALARAAVYSALTRAAELAVVVGCEETLRRVLSSVPPRARRTSLLERI